MGVFVFSNLAISLDGKIATRKRGLHPLGTPLDRQHMIGLRAQCDAVLVGGSTLRSYKKPILGKPRNPVNLLLSQSLEGISPRWAFFEKKDILRILFVTAKLPKNRLQAFGKSSEIVPLRPNTPVAVQILNYLKKQQLQRLLVEGGGGVMWDFASRNLIDEYHVTLTPKIVGGVTSPTLVDGLGFAPKDILNLELKQCQIVGNEIFLTYRR